MGLLLAAVPFVLARLSFVLFGEPRDIFPFLDGLARCMLFGLFTGGVVVLGTFIRAKFD
jgi:hypothetical protein